ncbi:uncharacterized protein [Primulina eburnea]|uniref:uncharacterized protein n=1 Tax=Primulina eburnea TaxID=1245227 RepID=UPI003C6C6930
MKIQQVFTSVAYPQSNGQVKVTNRTLVQGLKVRLGNAKGNWVDELPSVLWAYRTTPREGTKETPFNLVYGNETVLPAEIGLESARVMFYDEDNGARRATDLDLLEEKREAARFTWKLIRTTMHSLIIGGSFRETSRDSIKSSSSFQLIKVVVF